MLSNQPMQRFVSQIIPKIYAAHIVIEIVIHRLLYITIIKYGWGNT